MKVTTIGRRAWTIRTLVVLLVLQVPFGKRLGLAPDLRGAVVGEAIYWALTLGLIAYVLRVERRPLASVGATRPTWRSGLWGLIAGAVTIAGMAFIYLVVFPALGQKSEESGLQSILQLPIWFRVALVLRAAVFEELVYRGFAIERLTELTGFRSLAAMISLTAFTLAHLSYWGWTHLLVAGWGGLVLTVLYLWRRDLLSNMLAHFTTDAVGFLLG